MKIVTVTELRRNLESYIDQLKDGEVSVTRYGKIVARLATSSDNAQTAEKDTANDAKTSDRCPA